MDVYAYDQFPSPSRNHLCLRGIATGWLPGRPALPETASRGPGAAGILQGIANPVPGRGWLEGCATAGRYAAWQVVGDLQRSRAERVGRQAECRQPDGPAVLRKFHGGADTDCAGACATLSH